jgi:hypothetical protein
LIDGKKLMEEKRNIQYSADDIRNYLDGRLSDPEMQALEKAALEDPFLADAIEGIEESRKQSVSFESGMTDLRSRLSERTRKNDRKTGIKISFADWKIAASIIFVLGLTVFTYTFFINKKSSDLSVTTKKDAGSVAPSAMPENKKTDTTTIPSFQNLPVNSDADTTGNALIATKDEEKNNYRKKSKPESGNKKIPDKKDSEIPANGYSEPNADSAAERTRAAASVQNDALPGLRAKRVQEGRDEKASGLAISPDKAISENYIRGVVVDEKGKPIPFAPVKFKGSKKGTFTDTSGFFKLYLRNPGPDASVFIEPPGYEPVLTALKPDSTVFNRIQMQPAVTSAKGEEVIESYPKVTGWEAFITYINANKKISTSDSLLKGEEIISFIVHPDGKLSSFSVDKSISPSHDAEVLRLIRSGPVLNVKNGKKQKCRVSVPFP